MFEIIHPCDEVYHIGQPQSPGRELLFCRSGEFLVTMDKDFIHRDLVHAMARPAAKWLRIGAVHDAVKVWAERGGLAVQGGAGIYRLSEAGQKRLRLFPWELHAGEGLALLYALEVLIPAVPDAVGIWRDSAEEGEPQGIVPIDRVFLFEVSYAFDLKYEPQGDLKRIVIPDLRDTVRLFDGGNVRIHPVFLEEELRLFSGVSEDDEGRALFLVSTPDADMIRDFLRGQLDIEDILLAPPLSVARESFDRTALLRPLPAAEAAAILRYFLAKRKPPDH